MYPCASAYRETRSGMCRRKPGRGEGRDIVRQAGGMKRRPNPMRRRAQCTHAETHGTARRRRSARKTRCVQNRKRRYRETKRSVSKKNATPSRRNGFEQAKRKRGRTGKRETGETDPWKRRRRHCRKGSDAVGWDEMVCIQQRP